MLFVLHIFQFRPTKASAKGGPEPITTTKPQGRVEGYHHRPHPTGWAGGEDTMGGRGGGVV